MITSSKKAFTMVELVMVIMIVGILSSIALPRLSMQRDSAIASKCVHEVGQLLSEITVTYTSIKTFKQWKEMKIEDNITNISLSVSDGETGIVNGNELIHDNIVEYQCDGEKIVDILATTNPTTFKYQLGLTIVDTPNTPASFKAANILEERYKGLTPTFQM
ncbi:MAG: prepilin-type N-terminal cleavage/methylation domain-containing protein [Campylobacterota bacterium]|nr:prepilin-type N-terminal cleavage/methylation domain-containing protein [Campylobacterota bacterium]